MSWFGGNTWCRRKPGTFKKVDEGVHFNKNHKNHVKSFKEFNDDFE